MILKIDNFWERFVPPPVRLPSCLSFAVEIYLACFNANSWFFNANDDDDDPKPKWNQWRNRSPVCVARCLVWRVYFARWSERVSFHFSLTSANPREHIEPATNETVARSFLCSLRACVQPPSNRWSLQTTSLPRERKTNCSRKRWRPPCMTSRTCRSCLAADRNIVQRANEN